MAGINFQIKQSLIKRIIPLVTNQELLESTIRKSKPRKIKNQEIAVINKERENERKKNGFRTHTSADRVQRTILLQIHSIFTIGRTKRRQSDQLRAVQREAQNLRLTKKITEANPAAGTVSGGECLTARRRNRIGKIVRWSRDERQTWREQEQLSGGASRRRRHRNHRHRRRDKCD